MRFEPHDYQRHAINFVLENPKAILILEMGLGKTVITLTAIKELMFERFEVKKVLVVAPLRVADITWQEDIEKWDHTNDLVLSKILGSQAKRIQALNAKADIYVVNRENLVWLVDHYLKNKKRWDFDMMVLDESSSFKNPASKRFKAARKVVPAATRILELTGTPTPNGLTNLWPQIYLLDRGERLGRTLTEYRNTYFTPGRRNRTVIFDYVLKPGAEKTIYKRISDIAISMSTADYLQLPELVHNTIKVKMSEKERKIYDEMEKDFLIDIDEETIVAASAGVLANKLLQLANGAVYTSEHMRADQRRAIVIHDRKLDAIEELIEDYDDKPIMVLWAFKHDHERLKERLKQYNPRTLETREDYTEWNQKKIRLLLAHPASMGHGLNLQAGGNIIVWFGLTYTLEWYLQTNARLYRQGQKESVIIHHIVTENTRDEDAMLRLQQKKIDQADLVRSIKARIKQIKKEANSG